ncbi:MAG: hypothetical protein GQ573_06650 [Gammaproteobacteria bacterium]|nr:hypothetical protein [Gammaproteobacteria bacterium]
MTKDPSRWASISARPTHGTATPVKLPSVVPTDKRDCEVFWVSELLPTISELQALPPAVESCSDDSHGNHDVIVRLSDGNSIGVQVTELTYELEREREAQARRFLSNVRKCFHERRLSSSKKLLVKCFLPFTPSKKFKVPNPMDIADATSAFISGTNDSDSVNVPPAWVMFQWIKEGEFYMPTEGNIGIDCDLDALPRTLEMYSEAVSILCDKKSDSKSPWLLIWSTTFWRDKHWLGEEVLEHMRASFKSSSFTRVFFLESLDGQGMFEANLTFNEIKA